MKKTNAIRELEIHKIEHIVREYEVDEEHLDAVSVALKTNEDITEETKAKYYAVNTDLAIETAKKAKEDGVKQFIFMSSSIIYGDSAPLGKRKRITRNTQPSPANFYGDSKWQADKAIRELDTEDFFVVVLRPPMIYGKGCKGNYPVLAKLAKTLPVFPDIKNERSMLYIDNLSAFLCQIMLRKERGIFWPQNAEYSKTSELVKWIAEANNHRILISKFWNIGIKLAGKLPTKKCQIMILTIS